jgi:hypothetical protein
MNLIQSTILNSLPANKKKTPSGWISFNAPCCIHNGESADKRKRGGVMTSADGTISYHCFNCGWKSSFAPGRKLSANLRRLLGFLGVSDTEIKKLSIEALKLEGVEAQWQEKKKFVSFEKRPLPKNSHKLDIWLEKYIAKDLTDPQFNKIDSLLNYLKQRGVDPTWYDFMYSSALQFDFNHRIIIPFYWKGDVVGYTGRIFTEAKKVKYYTEVQPGYVFNMDAQDWSRKFVIVTEGPFDAIAIGGVSILGSEISDVQKELIQGLNRRVIVVPDRDAPGQKLIDQAIENRWSVAFPTWQEEVADVADAVLKYGRLYTMQSILKTTESNKLKINLKRKMNA